MDVKEVEVAQYVYGKVTFKKVDVNDAIEKNDTGLQMTNDRLTELKEKCELFCSGVAVDIQKPTHEILGTHDHDIHDLLY